MQSTLSQARCSYQPFGAAISAWKSRRREVLLAGAAGCVAGETRLYDPIQDKHITIKDLYQQQQAPIVQTLWGPVQAEMPFLKGVSRLYRLTTNSGQSCLVTDNHRFLSSHGWKFLSQYSSGESILISSPSPQERCSEQDQPVFQQDVHHLTHTRIGYQDDYLQDQNPCGVLPLWEVTSDLAFVPLRDDALLHSHVGLHVDDRVYARGCTPLALSSFHLSMLDYSLLIEQMACAQCHALLENRKQYCDWYQHDAQSQNKKLPPLPIGTPHPCDDSMRHLLHCCTQYRASLEGDELGSYSLLQLPDKQSSCSEFDDSIRVSLALALSSDAYNLSMLTSNGLLPFGKCHYTAQWDTVSSIKYERTDEYFDLHVPCAEHYLADGIWHHNTGKSRALLEKLHYCADKYPGMRAIIIRKTRESLTQTAMVTYENKVLPEGWLGNLIHFRTSEQEYRYPNGSVIAIGGMDKSTKIMSAEYDMAYVQEGTELFEDDWEALTTRLRNGVMPYQQLIADCNPGPPTHWLKRRCDRGATLMLESRHEDNPSVTPEYLAALDALTGVRYLRLRLGKWAAAEGMVYDDWDRFTHLVSKQKLVEWGIFQDESEKLNRNVIKRVLAGVDWGYTNPGVIQVYGVDGDERLYLLREIYKTGKVIDWWIDQAKKLQHEYDIEQFICDPAEPSYIAQFNGNGLPSIGAVNDIAPGISELQSRLKLAGDGRTRFYVYESSLKERDEKREAAHEPCSFEQEIDAYAWPISKNGQSIKEVPVKVNDHSCDVARYVAMRLNRSVYRLPMSDDDDSTSTPTIHTDQAIPFTQPFVPTKNEPVEYAVPQEKPIDAFDFADRVFGGNW